MRRGAGREAQPTQDIRFWVAALPFLHLGHVGAVEAVHAICAHDALLHLFQGGLVLLQCSPGVPDVRHARVGERGSPLQQASPNGRAYVG